MSTLKKILLVLLILTMIALIVIFWGSIFSGVVVFCLIMTLPTYLYNRFINTDRESDFTDDDNY